MTHPSRTDAEYQPLPHDPAYADMESPHELETIAHFDNWAAPAQETGASGRRVLGATLVVLGAVWVGYTAWAAGRVSMKIRSPVREIAATRASPNGSERGSGAPVET